MNATLSSATWRQRLAALICLAVLAGGLLTACGGGGTEPAPDEGETTEEEAPSE